MLPAGNENFHKYVKLMQLLDFDVWKMFDKLGCDAIYTTEFLCNARTSGVRGLGTELVERGQELSKEKGCTHTYVCVSSIYSRRIFDKLGYKVLREIRYDEFRDEQGELYLKDTREHTTVAGCVKQL